MRKAMWYGAMLALLGAGGVYLAADYANRHPDSLLGQCVVTSYQVGRVYSPAAQVGEESVERTFAAIKQVMERPGMAPTTVNLAPPEPEPLAAQEPHCPQACPQAEGGEELHVLGKVVIQPDADEPAGDRPQVGPAAGGAEEAEVPPPMPRARDNGDLPPKMPYAADEAEDAGQGIDFWWKLIEASGHCTDAGAQEECEPKKTDTGASPEAPTGAQHCPGCPHMGSCPSSGCCPHQGKYTGCPHLDPAVEDKAVPERTEGGSEEQSVPPATEPGLPKGEYDAKCPAHRDVDTTEFRPSDGKPFDFGSFPY